MVMVMNKRQTVHPDLLKKIAAEAAQELPALASKEEKSFSVRQIVYASYDAIKEARTLGVRRPDILAWIAQKAGMKTVKEGTVNKYMSDCSRERRETRIFRQRASIAITPPTAPTAPTAPTFGRSAVPSNRPVPREETVRPDLWPKQAQPSSEAPFANFTPPKDPV